MTPHPKLTKGFSLIEVLIAAVILFGSITIVSQAFRGAVDSSLKAKRSVEIARVVPLLLNTIEFRLKSQPLNKAIFQEGVLDDAIFFWSAKVVEQDGPADKLSPENGSIIVFEDKFYLWQVELAVEQGGIKKVYSYKQLTWGNSSE